MQNKILSYHRRYAKKISPHAVVIFLLILTLCLLLVFTMVMNRNKVETLVMEQLILEKTIKINEVISKLLYKTEMLSSLVLQSSNGIDSFDQFAAAIVDDPAILNILIAPDGVVSHVYPLEGNEAVMGLNFFAEGAGNREALIAKETGQLVLGGPFDAVQGGQVLVGRLPVFINKTNDTKDFWGLVSVTLKYPQALDAAGLNELKIQGFAYEIWRINPDTNEKQVIVTSGHSYDRYTHYIERELSIANAKWFFRILPVRTWYEFPETWAAIFLSICISLLVAAVIQNNQNLKTLKKELEILSSTDSLTGISNRRYFMETACWQQDRVIRQGGQSYIILFDLDLFKSINDTHTHQAGDAVLEEVAKRVSKTLRPYDLFARYGGEEFIIFVSEIDQSDVWHLAERIRQNIGDTPIAIDTGQLFVTASLGIAPAAPVFSLDDAITFADTAMYKAKREGRNKSVFYEV